MQQAEATAFGAALQECVVRGIQPSEIETDAKVLQMLNKEMDTDAVRAGSVPYITPRGSCLSCKVCCLVCYKMSLQLV